MMIVHSTFQIGTYQLADANQPDARECLLAVAPFTAGDVQRRDAWMPKTVVAGCGVWRCSA